MPFNSAGKRKLFIEFIASDRREVITLRIKEHVIYKRLRAFNNSGFARTQPLIYFLSASSPSDVLFSSACLVSSSLAREAISLGSSPKKL